MNPATSHCAHMAAMAPKHAEIKPATAASGMAFHGLSCESPERKFCRISESIDAIYESARTGRAAKLEQPGGPTRGPDLGREPL
ncbi:hypothetical protein AWB74_07744 [Caballeronia arvi]|uniref:Uncharacterized protein n=1 Tax=Caballeronia arvi TaxID=1777135 RepID=A0A158L0N1_9BURK|nr:hypothetical protein AWB74_07744 [Caballeronia arvi]